jgi:excisionase family DNA binding protein
LKNLATDVKDAGLAVEEIRALRISDFDFQFVPKEDKVGCKRIQEFIQRHEWLGKMPTRPTHRFVAMYKGHLAGVVVMATPNSFSNLLGKENRHLEKLISRGACISWSPKNLGSALVMFAVRWLAKNTGFRIFTAYSDVEARELGTIYQACNFTYLGQNSGARLEYFDPIMPERGWFSDRIFRKHSQIRRYARELGIAWNASWSSHDKTHRERIPTDVREKLKHHAKLHRTRCLSRALPPKHKYAYILGTSKSETKRLKALFKDLNPNLTSLPYPKYRGPQSNTADNIIKIEEEILTEPTLDCRPQETARDFEYLSVREAASMLGVSVWTIYKLIESDPNFPAHNIGVKKKFVVSRKDLVTWMESKTRRQRRERQRLPSGQDLLKLKGE